MNFLIWFTDTCCSLHALSFMHTHPTLPHTQTLALLARALLACTEGIYTHEHDSPSTFTIPETVVLTINLLSGKNPFHSANCCHMVTEHYPELYWNIFIYLKGQININSESAVFIQHLVPSNVKKVNTASARGQRSSLCLVNSSLLHPVLLTNCRSVDVIRWDSQEIVKQFRLTACLKKKKAEPLEVRGHHLDHHTIQHFICIWFCFDMALFKNI